MASSSTKELRSLLRQARKDGRKPFAGYIQEGDSSIHVLLLADASEFVYRRLKQYEPILLAVFQAKWPNRNIIKVTVVRRINNEDARDTIRLGGRFRVFRGEKGKGEQNTVVARK
jgi:hypothetical protein